MTNVETDRFPLATVGGDYQASCICAGQLLPVLITLIENRYLTLQHLPSMLESQRFGQLCVHYNNSQDTSTQTG